MHLRVEEAAAHVVDRKLALQADALREPGRVEPDQLAQRAVRVRELLDQGVPRGVIEPVVRIVDPEVRGVDRVIRDEPPEIGLDDVPELAVERTRGRSRSGTRYNELVHLALDRCRGHATGGA